MAVFGGGGEFVATLPVSHSVYIMRRATSMDRNTFSELPLVLITQQHIFRLREALICRETTSV